MMLACGGRLAVCQRVLSFRALSSSPPTTAVCFDIDGVLCRGEAALPHAQDAVDRLKAAGVPFQLVTNGGGVLEATKAAKVSKQLGTPISPEQMIVCHTPLKSLVEEYADRRVLVLGSSDILSVARSYGLQKAMCVEDVVCDEPSRYPFFSIPHRPLSVSLEDDHIAAVWLMYDPIHWSLDLQIALDVIRGRATAGSALGTGSHQAIPVYACNPDLVFSGEYGAPRLAAGAFTQTLEFMFHQLTGEHLVVQSYGKPLKVTFDLALDHLAAGAGVPSSTFTKVFMIGDNPAADIRGANDAGPVWTSVLVETGVYTPEPDQLNDATDPADHVVSHVGEAIDIVLEHVAAAK